MDMDPVAYDLVLAAEDDYVECCVDADGTPAPDWEDPELIPDYTWLVAA